MANDRPSLESLVQRRRTLNGMYAGTFWKHRTSGGIYVINSVGIRESDYEPVIHYSPVNCPDMEWDRDLSDFMAMIGVGEQQPRFVRVIPKVTYE